MSISSHCCWPHTKVPAGHFSWRGPGVDGTPTCCDWMDAGVMPVVSHHLLRRAAVKVEWKFECNYRKRKPQLKNNENKPLNATTTYCLLFWFDILYLICLELRMQIVQSRASHAVNWPAAALSVKQMLEWQCDCHSCCFFRSVAVVLSSSSSCSHQCLFTVFMPEGWCSGASLWDRSCHSIAPASRSLRRAWDNGRVAGGWDTVFLSLLGRSRERAGYSERKRLWDCASWSLGCGGNRSTMLGIYVGLMGPGSDEYTESQQGSTLTFLFSPHVQRCGFSLW